MTKKYTLDGYRLWVIFHEAYDLMTKYEEDILKKAGITREQFLVLGMIKLIDEVADKPVIMARLASGLNRQPNSVTAIIDRMEKNGLIQKLRNLPDRRAINLLLTPKGDETFRIGLKLGKRLIRAIFSVYTEEEMQILIALLKKLKAKVNEESGVETVKEDSESMNPRKVARFLTRRRI